MWKAALEIVANVTGWWKRRDELKNAADVKEAQKRQYDVNANSAIEKQVAARDVKAAEKGWAE